MSDLAPPSLADLPTQPPPPPPASSRNRRSNPLASREYNAVRRPLAPFMFLLLAMQFALVATTYVVAVWRPSMPVSFAVVAAGNVVWAWSFVTILSILGRTR